MVFFENVYFQVNYLHIVCDLHKMAENFKCFTNLICTKYFNAVLSYFEPRNFEIKE